jgi:hypothetical protein
MHVDPKLSLKSYFQNRHPNVIWYRLHVKVSPSQVGLALREWNLGSVFEIYVNGEKLIAAGQTQPFRPSTFNARLLARVPDEAIKTGSLVIALRIYISANDWVNAFPGYFPYNLVIGEETALQQSIWLELIGRNVLNWFFQLMGLGLAIISIALFAAQRKHREYLWMFLLFLTIALQTPGQVYLLLHTLPASWAYVEGAFQIAIMVFQILLFLAFLRMPMARWIKIWLWIAAAGLLYNSMLTANGQGTSTSVLVSTIPQLSIIAGVIPVLLLVHWRRDGNSEAGILLVPAIVNSLLTYFRTAVFIVSTVPALAVPALKVETALLDSTWGPLTLDGGSMVGYLYVLSLAIIIVLRSTRIAKHQAFMEAELAAAREVQKLLLPENVESAPGFRVEIAYEPAQQVGGDFFQVLPLGEGSLLVVIGDVAGKGFPAAMLVSVLVGAIRGITEHVMEPAELLARLNERLIARVGSSFATALAARIDPTGAVTLANAGHLAPYLNGREVEIPGAFPLGIAAATEYETVRIDLPRGSRLTFYSDGIVEAQDATGEMFGFERSLKISTEPVKKIIEAARTHGQQDDMTAIAITRAPTESALWSADGSTRELGMVAP